MAQAVLYANTGPAEHVLRCVGGHEGWARLDRF